MSCVRESMKITSLRESAVESSPVAQTDQEEMLVGGVRKTVVDKHVLVEPSVRLEQTLEPSRRHVQTTNALVVRTGVQVVEVLAVEQPRDRSMSHAPPDFTLWRDGTAMCFPAPKCLASRPPTRSSMPRRSGEEATRTREDRPCRPLQPILHHRPQSYEEMLRLRVDRHAVDAAGNHLLRPAELNVGGPRAQGGVLSRICHIGSHR